MTEEQHQALALAAILENPVEPDGTFVGLSDSELIARALRAYAASLAAL